MPRALITGVTGQDGVYLARLLRGRGYDVIGTAQPGAAARGSSKAPGERSQTSYNVLAESP